jgi:hypothetical protein
MTLAEMLSAARLVSPMTSWEIARVVTEKPKPMTLKSRKQEDLATAVPRRGVPPGEGPVAQVGDDHRRGDCDRPGCGRVQVLPRGGGPQDVEGRDVDDVARSADGQEGQHLSGEQSTG